ncbi:hypothetical protein ACIQUB_06295 [Rhizobium sp. NPDC090275]|uniref:hypothetical protein n=1 Tax=Rhizobium sp. NPDC090275 TaxID=3364498 RepID=UPI00383A7678
MEIYHYHPATLEFLTASEADESPLEPGVVVIPAHATIVAPPVAVAGYARVWNLDQEAWGQLEDHRGETWWIVSTGALVYISFIGDPSEQGLTNVEPPPVIPTEYTLPADLPWDRMTESEAELIQDGVDAAPAKTRNMINKATSFTTGTDAFTKFKAIITAIVGAERADAIMGYPLEAAAVVLEEMA